MFAANYTAHDHWQKREKKGFLFTIGDEPCLSQLPDHAQNTIMGKGQYSSISAEGLLKAAQAHYHVYHFHIMETGAGSRYRDSGALPLDGTANLIKVQSWKDIPPAIARIVADGVESNPFQQAGGKSCEQAPQVTKEELPVSDGADKPTDMML
jgi:hypothetical protein